MIAIFDWLRQFFVKRFYILRNPIKNNSIKNQKSFKCVSLPNQLKIPSMKFQIPTKLCA